MRDWLDPNPTEEYESVKMDREMRGRAEA